MRKLKNVLIRNEGREKNLWRHRENKPEKKRGMVVEEKTNDVSPCEEGPQAGEQTIKEKRNPTLEGKKRERMLSKPAGGGAPRQKGRKNRKI